MDEINESDRFECKVVNIIDNLMWKGVTVEHVKSQGRVYFARVKADDFDIKIGDTLYIGVKPLPYELEERSTEVTLYDKDNNKLDWTLI